MIKNFISELVSVFLVDKAVILDVEQKDLERLPHRDTVIRLRKKAISVIQLGQGMHAVSLTLERKKQYHNYESKNEAVKHNVGIIMMNERTQRDDRRNHHKHTLQR